MIKRLLEQLRKMDIGNLMPNGQPDMRHHALADKIEAAIAERYIERPVDADGVPIRLDDRVTSHRWSDGAWVCQLSYNDLGWWVVDSCGATEIPNNCHHAKPRIIEEVLHDFATEFENEIAIINPLVEKYAAELREMMGRDDG